MSKEDIINEINKYHGLGKDSRYSSYYIGITNNINRRLFTEHAVDENKDRWIYCPANSKQCAEDVEKYFLNLGMDGDTGGGNDETNIVYSYLKNAHTKP